MSNQNVSAELSVLISQLITARNEISNLRQQLNTLKHTHRKEVENIKQLLLKPYNGSLVQDVSTPSPENEQATSSDQNVITFPHQMIGTIDTGLSSKRAVPRQTCILSQSQGILRIDTKLFTNAHHALDGLEQFSHMWILFYFHKVESSHIHSKVAPPRLNGAKMGVFATRSPNRPTPIGLSLVKIEKVEGNCVFFSGVDMLDGTPVLDIKPYIPNYDTPYPTQLTLPPPQSTHVHRWQRLPIDSDSRSEDGDLDLQERLLIGESHSSEESQDVQSDSSLLNPLEEVRVLDGRDADDVFAPAQPTMTSFVLESHTNYDRSPSRTSQQREGPEGSEGGSPIPTPLHHHSSSVRIPSWINHPPIHTLTVHFADDCLERVLQLTESPEAADRLQSAISSVLREDPRSVYVRERYSEDPYICNMLGYEICCLFDDTSHACLVTSIDATRTVDNSSNNNATDNVRTTVSVDNVRQLNEE